MFGVVSFGCGRAVLLHRVLGFVAAHGPSQEEAVVADVQVETSSGINGIIIRSIGEKEWEFVFKMPTCSDI